MKFKNKLIKGFLGQGKGAALNSKFLLQNKTQKVVYSFNRVNNISPLLIKTEYLLKSVFRSMFSLISRPIYLIKHDKIIIRLFVYLSPKLDKYLDTSTTTSRSLPLRIEGNSTYFTEQSATKHALAKTPNGRGAKQATVAGFSSNVSGFKVRKFLRFKSFRPNVIEILNSQIHALLVPQDSNSIATLRSDKSSFLALTGEARNNYITPRFPYTSLLSNFKFSLDKLCLIFEKIFNKKVEFEIIKAQLPFQDSNILAQILGYNANKYKFRQMFKILIPRAVIKNPSKERLRNSAPTSLASQSLNGKEDINTLAVHNTLSLAGKYANLGNINVLNTLTPAPSSYLPPLFNSNLIGEGEDLKQAVTASLPLLRSSSISRGGNSLSYLSGMNIKLAGRLMTQSMRPRFTVQSIQEGSLARVKVHFIEKSRFTGKNKRGAFSFTVSISHVFN
jgi:hypothetical protein